MTSWHCTNDFFAIGGDKSTDIALVEAPPESDYKQYEIACRGLIGKELELHTPHEGKTIKMKIHPIMAMKLYEMPEVTGYGYLIKEKLWGGASGSPILDTDGKVVAMVHGWRNPDMWIITRTCL